MKNLLLTRNTLILVLARGRKTRIFWYPRCSFYNFENVECVIQGTTCYQEKAEQLNTALDYFI